MLRILFWLFIILFIIGIINNSIDLKTVNNNLVITIDYVNFMGNTTNSIKSITSLVTELFAPSQPSTPSE